MKIKNLSFMRETGSFKVTSPEYFCMDGCLSALKKPETSKI